MLLKASEYFMLNHAISQQGEVLAPRASPAQLESQLTSFHSPSPPRTAGAPDAPKQGVQFGFTWRCSWAVQTLNRPQHSAHQVPLVFPPPYFAAVPYLCQSHGMSYTCCDCICKAIKKGPQMLLGTATCKNNL